MSVYNGEHDLEASIESVLQQRDIQFEFIIVNDGSTDGSAKILDRYLKLDRRIRVFHQENSGLTTALIRGCCEASGQFIARQDVGDLSLPGRLKKQADALNANPDWAFVSCLWELVGPAGEILSGTVPHDHGASIASSLKSGDAKGLKGPHHGSVMFRRKQYEKVGGYRKEFYFAQDLDLWTRLIEVGKLGFVDEALYSVVFSKDSITGKWPEKQKQVRKCIIEALEHRRAGKSETSILELAKTIRPGANNLKVNQKFDPDYFLGSCLAARNDKRATKYLIQHLRNHPLNYKAVWKLLRVSMANFQFHRTQ